MSYRMVLRICWIFRTAGLADVTLKHKRCICLRESSHPDFVMFEFAYCFMSCSCCLHLYSSY
ncbi:hypothetical protein M758_2G205800 [Ceratodon purpureus]|nr:hypothetical protein M758_2G205800 [Ceratodon purpureus]